MTPTVTPAMTPELITSPDELTTFKLAVGQFRLAEKNALKTLEPAVVEQLATFADSEALAAVVERIEELRAQGLYQELVVRQLDVQQAVVRDGGQTAGVLVLENHILRTYQPAADGDRLVDEEGFDGQIVYGLIYLDGRWKVERIRLLDSSQP